MAKNKSNKAILVLESPWQLDDGDANRSSVIPFIEGIAKLAGDTDVYYANFYDLASFRKAFECLCKLKHKNTIVYVAAHGHRFLCSLPAQPRAASPTLRHNTKT